MLDLEHDEQLRWLMQKWGLDRNATLERILEHATAAEKSLDVGQSRSE